MKPRALILAAGLLLLPAGAALRADDSDNGEARLRETLRSTMLQLRDAQNDLANAQAAQAAAEDDKKALGDQLALLKKHGEDDRETAQAQAGQLKAQLARDEARIAGLSKALDEWKDEAQKAQKEAHGAEGERDQASLQMAATARKNEDLEARNEALFVLASQILDRFEKFSLGDQFLAREPFIGRARVALENQIQDYNDKILAERASAAH